jgi:hypothetical protein
LKRRGYIFSYPDFGGKRISVDAKGHLFVASFVSSFSLKWLQIANSPAFQVTANPVSVRESTETHTVSQVRASPLRDLTVIARAADPASGQCSPQSGRMIMLKFMCAAAVVVVAGSAPAFADDMMACDDASIMKTEEMAMAMTEPAQKESMEMAMKEVDMAKMAMKDGKMDDCSMHLDAANKAAMMK